VRKKILAAIAAGAVAALGLMVAPASAATAGTAQLSVLHGIPDTPVDVYVNGELTLDDFQPGDLAGPLDLPAGAYEVALTAADATDASDPVLGPASVTLEAGKNYTAVAHLSEAGDPTLTPYVNDTAPTAAGEGRLTVRHDAAAPAVDVLAGGTPVIEDLANPEEATLNLAAGTISASVAAAGTTDLAVAVQTISGLHSAPGGVNSGSGGQLAERDAMVQVMFVLAGLLAAGGVAASTVVIARARAKR
jgi:hypothetical protein